MPNVYTCLKTRGDYRRHPKTGVEWPTEIEVFEVLDAANDRRKYVVTQRLVGTFHDDLRRREFVCAGYMDLDGGHVQAARALAREWAAEPEPEAKYADL